MALGLQRGSGRQLVSASQSARYQLIGDFVQKRAVLTTLDIVPQVHWSENNVTKFLPADRYYAPLGMVPASGYLPNWMAGSGAGGEESASIAYQLWDATSKRMYMQLSAVGRSYVGGRADSAIFHPLGPGGNPTTYQPKNASVTTLIIEFCARFDANADYTTNGVGMKSGTAGSVHFNTATDHFLQVLRNAGQWELGTCDGSTISQTAGGTADGSFHEFRVDVTESSVKLYVDGTLVITKTTNLPARPMVAHVTTPDNVNTIGIVNYLVRWAA